VVALTYRATVDVPARFRKSKVVGAVFGLTCSKYQSGEIDRSGRISRCGDEMMGVMLYEVAGGYNAEPSRPHPLRQLCCTLVARAASLSTVEGDAQGSHGTRGRKCEAAKTHRNHLQT
jgi:transposase